MRERPPETVEQNKDAAWKGGEDSTRYSLRAFADGTLFVEVDTDQDLFDGLSVKEMQHKAEKIIREKFQGKNLGDSYRAYISKRSAEHFAFPTNRRLDRTTKQDKMRASPELDNLLRASVFRKNVPDDGRHPEATGGFDKLDTIFRIDGKRIYQAEISVKVTDKGPVFHELSKFRDITERNSDLASGDAVASNDDASIENIP